MIFWDSDEISFLWSDFAILQNWHFANVRKVKLLFQFFFNCWKDAMEFFLLEIIRDGSLALFWVCRNTVRMRIAGAHFLLYFRLKFQSAEVNYNRYPRPILFQLISGQFPKNKSLESIINTLYILPIIPDHMEWHTIISNQIVLNAAFGSIFGWKRILSLTHGIIFTVIVSNNTPFEMTIFAVVYHRVGIFTLRLRRLCDCQVR